MGPTAGGLGGEQRPATPIAVMVGVSLTVLLVFGFALRHGFTWDDRSHLLENPHLNPPTWAGLQTLWSGPYQNLYSPVVYTVWAAVALVARRADGTLSPLPFHALCLALHLLNSVAVHVLLRRLLRDRRAAAVGAALFALHPLQVEPVVWVSGLKDVLFGTVALAALIALTAAREGAPLWRRWAAFATATALYGLALLTKPAATALPVVALSLEGLVLQRPRRCVLLTFTVWASMAFPLIWLTREVQPVPAVLAGVSVLARPVVALDALGFYVSKLLAPVELAVDYGRKPFVIFSDARTILHVALALVGVATCWWAARRQSLHAAAGAAFAGALLPVLGLVPFVFQYISTVADRYAYLAMLGAALALGAVLRGRSPVAHRLAWAVVALLALRSAIQVRVWRDELSLFSHAVAANPHSYVAHKNLAEALDRAGRLVEATGHARQAVALEPYGRSWFHLGTLLADQGQVEEARDYLSRVLEVTPQDGGAHFNLGLLAKRQGEYEQAAAHFRAAAELEPKVRDRAAEQLRRLGRPAGFGERASLRQDGLSQ